MNLKQKDWESALAESYFCWGELPLLVDVMVTVVLATVQLLQLLLALLDQEAVVQSIHASHVFAQAKEIV